MLWDAEFFAQFKIGPINQAFDVSKKVISPACFRVCEVHVPDFVEWFAITFTLS